MKTANKVGLLFILASLFILGILILSPQLDSGFLMSISYLFFAFGGLLFLTEEK